MEDNRETIRNIKKELRLFMNGVTSAQQRKLGMNYNIIFGVDIPHLKGIAAKFHKNTDLAMELWKENIRESKLLAIFLLPEESYAEVAERWIGECRYYENADHLAHNVLRQLPDACEKALKWTGSDNELYLYCGFITLAHLFREGHSLNAEEEKVFFGRVSAILSNSGSHNIATQAFKALTFYCDDEPEKATRFNTLHGKELVG